MSLSKRDYRIEARVRAEDKTLIETAAHYSGVSVSDFMLTAARTAAEAVVTRHHRIILDHQSSRVFVEMLLEEQPVPPTLHEAVLLHERLVESDPR